MRKAIIFTVSAILVSALCSANAFVVNLNNIAKLNQAIDQYKCQQINWHLTEQLDALAQNQGTVSKICKKMPKGIVQTNCESGPYSLRNELVGLGNIAVLGSPATCNMVQEDQQEINLYLNFYLYSKDHAQTT